MRIKKETRYGKHDFTTVEASLPEATAFTIKNKILWDSEHAVALQHVALRRAIKNAQRNLAAADARLEANVEGGADVSTLIQGVNSLGILQSYADEVDNGVRALAAAIESHARVLAALKADVNEPAK